MTEKNINKTSSGESSLTGIGQHEIKDNEVKTNAECFLNYKLEELTYGHLELWNDFHYGLP